MADMYGCVIVKTSTALNGKTVTFVDETGASVSGTISGGICKKFLPAFHHYTITVLRNSNLGTSAECDMSCGYTYTFELDLNTDTWAGIKNIVNLGLASTYLPTTFRKTVNLTDGTSFVVQPSVNKYGLNEADFIATAIYTTHNMNAGSTNAGGFKASAMHTYLNETLYNLLPSDLKSVISDKTLKRSAGSQSTTLQSESSKIWLPTEFEVFGAITYSASTEKDVQKHYSDIFPDAASRIRKNAGAAAYWWLSSPGVSLATTFCFVDAGGTPNYNGAGNAYGVCPCFRIAPS